MKEKVIEVINQIRPMLNADGGDIEFVSLEDGVVKVRLQGACSGCPSAIYTLKLGVEKVLKERLPGIKSVEAETNQEQGL